MSQFRAANLTSKSDHFMKIILFQPDIAQNLGAVMRLSACFDVGLEIIEPCGFPLTAKALRRTAMDYGEPESLTRHSSWDVFKANRDSDKTAVNRLILFTTKAATPLQDFKFQPSDHLLFGRESAGVPDHVHDAATHLVIIPLSGNARSFNLATSASIGLWEVLRQTRYSRSE